MILEAGQLTLGSLNVLTQFAKHLGDNMKVLVIGKGGREHAIVRALKHSPSVTEVHAIPGNPGYSTEALCHNLSTGDHDALISFVGKNDIDLVIIGPEVELAQGLSDLFRTNGILTVGPSQEASRLESSKIFAKDFMMKAAIPTAHSVVVTSCEEVTAVMSDFRPPYVLKADGLAAGKGVYICKDVHELEHAAKELFVEKKLGSAGEKALLEQSLDGWELSYLCLTDGRGFEALPLAQDHKRLLDGDCGPNTGGMGVVAPIKLDEKLNEEIKETILKPTVKLLEGMGLLYRGVIYVGLMITDEGPQVLEYNVRFGDPEAQVIMPLLDQDWGEVFHSLAQGNLPNLEWKSLFSACVVLAAEGYPDSPAKGVEIKGDIFASTASSYFLHAGTEHTKDGLWRTNGGRILNAVGIGSNLQEALDNAYAQAKKVNWQGCQMRRDIGEKMLRSSRAQ